MKRGLEIKGRNVEERVASIELILKRFSRKLSTKVIGILPVSPVFDYIYSPDGQGVILRRIFPANGTVTKVCYNIENKGKSPIEITFNISNNLKRTSTSMSYTLKKLTDVMDIEFAVEAGDMLSINMQTAEGEEGQLRGIWLGMLYEVGYKELRNKDFLLDELESMIQEEEK